MTKNSCLDIEYALLKDFLISGLSIKAFVESKNGVLLTMKKEMWKQMMTLMKCGIVETDTYSYELRYARTHRDKFLNRISMYEKFKNEQ